MVALGFEEFNYRRVEPGSSLFVEILKSNVTLNFMKSHIENLVNKTYPIEEFNQIIQDRYSTFKSIFDDSIQDTCELNYIKFLEKAENEGNPFKLKDSEKFLKQLSKEHKVLNIYKEFKASYNRFKNLKDDL